MVFLLILKSPTVNKLEEKTFAYMCEYEVEKYIYIYKYIYINKLVVEFHLYEQLLPLKECTALLCLQRSSDMNAFSYGVQKL